MSVQVTMSKEDVIARLKAQLAVAKVYDREQAKKHKEDEKAWFASFKTALKEALTWDYAKAKSRQKWSGGGYVELQVRHAPTCPLSQAVQIQRAIARVEASSLKSYRMSAEGIHSDIYAFLFWEPNPPRSDVC